MKTKITGNPGNLYIKFKHRCECGNILIAKTPMPNDNFEITCNKCGSEWKVNYETGHS